MEKGSETVYETHIPYEYKIVWVKLRGVIKSKCRANVSVRILIDGKIKESFTWFTSKSDVNEFEMLALGDAGRFGRVTVEISSDTWVDFTLMDVTISH